MHATATDTSLLSQVPFIVDAVWAAGLALNATRGTDKALSVIHTSIMWVLCIYTSVGQIIVSLGIHFSNTTTCVWFLALVLNPVVCLKQIYTILA